MKKYYEPFFDQDETIVNLSQYVVERYNEAFQDNMDWRDNKSYWWGDCKKAPKFYFERLLLQKGTFLFPKPIKDSIEILNKLNNDGFNIHILTMPQWNSHYCMEEKIAWTQQYLPFLNVETNFHCSGNKGLLAKSNRILIDDNEKHLEAWREQGGLAIAFGRFNWNKNWKGLRVYNFQQLYELINELEEEAQYKLNGEKAENWF